VTDNFFEVGGDSIQSLQVVSRARKAGWLVNTRQVFDDPTVEGLAGVAVSAHEAEQAHKELHTPLPLTPIQAFFFEHRPDAPAHWNQSVLLRTPDGELDVARLEQALLAVVTRHDALRLRFAHNEAGEWFQQVAPSEDGRILEIMDLRESGENWKDHLREHGERLQASLNLNSGPIMRAGWFRVPDGSGRLLLAIHHLSVDGVSWRVLLGDLQDALEQKGPTITLPSAVLPWSAWVDAVRHYGERPETADELAWWQDYLADTSPDIPVDLIAERPLSSSETIRWQADEDLTRRLIDAAPRAYRMGVEDVLLAALGQALGGWSGQSRVLVDLEGHGREDVLPGLDLSSTVGWFTTRYTAVVPVAED
ncbi:hypothetical protein AD948_00155, partial [Acetobacter senegalensis]